jgi:hypothetical protein
VPAVAALFICVSVALSVPSVAQWRGAICGHPPSAAIGGGRCVWRLWRRLTLSIVPSDIEGLRFPRMTGLDGTDKERGLGE